MEIRSILLVVALLAGCSTAVSPTAEGLVSPTAEGLVPPTVQGLVPEARPSTSDTTTPTCDRLLVVPPEAARSEVVGVLEAVVRSDCARSGGVDAVCSDLFLIAATDPVVAVSLGFAPDLVERLVVLHLEVLREAVDRSRRQLDEGLAAALQLVIDLDVGAAVGSDLALADFVADRGAPAIVEPIRLAEAGCT